MRILLLLSLALLTTTALAQPAADVLVVRPPEGAFVPDVAVDRKGVVHMVYALDRNAYYARSTDDGATFSAPVRVNSGGPVEYRMGERGPKLAVGADGVVHVAWMDMWSPGVKTYVQYARSRDGGRTFEKQRAVSSMSGVDGATLTADGKGSVLVFWHAASPAQDKVPMATWLHVARSSDNGATFGPDGHPKIAGVSGLACSMCMMRARIGADGNAYLAFRSAQDSIRDFYVLKGAPTGADFAAVRVNQDNWKLDECPMCGPELTADTAGRPLCAFMSRHHVYWSRLDGSASALHVGTPAGEQDEIYPTAVANRKGEVLFVWQVGPMSTTGQATVKWATYTADGKPTGRSGSLGVTTSGTKATAFVGRDDRFRIVTTAR